MIHINHGTASQAHVPFGGVKESGLGAYSLGTPPRTFYERQGSLREVGISKGAPMAADDRGRAGEPPSRGEILWSSRVSSSLLDSLDRLGAAILGQRGDRFGSGLSDQAMGMVFERLRAGLRADADSDGLAADRRGPRIALDHGRVVEPVQVLTADGFDSGRASHVRFLFGRGGGRGVPRLARAFYNWLPPGERGIANGICSRAP